MKSRFIFLVACAGLSSLVAGARADEAKYALPVGTSYKAYATAATTQSLDGDVDKVRREKLGSSLSVLAQKQTLAREIEGGYATVYAYGAQTTLRVPLGWFAVDSKTSPVDSLVFSPDLSVKFVAREALNRDKIPRRPDEFERIKKTAIVQTQARLKAGGFKVGVVTLIEGQNQSFVVSAPLLVATSGRIFDYVERFAQRSSPSERADYWANFASDELIVPPLPPISISLLAPHDKFERHLPLLGLMVRDTGLLWRHIEAFSSRRFEAEFSNATQILRVAEEATTLLKAGDAKALRARFPRAFEDSTPAEIQAYLKQEIVPFLKRLPNEVTRTEIVVATDKASLSPLLEVFVERYFDAKDHPSYVISMKRVGNKIEFLGAGILTDADRS